VSYQSEQLPLAETEEEWLALLAGDDPRIVRTREEWDRALADDSRRASLLPNCDEETVRAFSERLIFRNGGLAGANYAMIEDKVTYRSFRLIWNQFGIGDKLFADYNNKECSRPGTCSPLTACICTSNC
jgi:hypothetical protein